MSAEEMKLLKHDLKNDPLLLTLSDREKLVMPGRKVHYIKSAWTFEYHLTRQGPATDSFYSEYLKKGVERLIDHVSSF